MKKVDEGYDRLLWSNYELHSSTVQELKALAKSWYGDTDLTKFDDRSVRDSYENSFIEMKRSGLTSNYFFAYRDQDGQHYLMDGFNRLFTNYGDLGDLDSPVYIKIITDELADWQLMHIMFRLNMWKLQGDGHWAFKPDEFFDRGFRLFLSKKLGVDICSYQDSGWRDRTREHSDFDILTTYFRKEWIDSNAFAYSLAGISALMSRETIISDIKQILKLNDYMKQPFGNYRVFLEVYVTFLSSRRVYDGDLRDYSFEYYLDKLKEDTKFFNKFQKMSGTDSTRKNAYNWIREIDKP
jgi:hypothetical protein